VSDRLLVEESHALPLVHFQVVLPTGSLEDPNGQEGLTRLCARLMRRGTRHKATAQIEDAIDSLGAELGIETAPGFVRFSGSTIRRSLEPLLALVGEMLNEPSFPEPELAQLKRESVAALIELTDSDQSLVSTHFRRALYRGHAYGRSSLGNRRTIESITLDQVKARYTQGLARSARTVGFAGDITEADASRLVAKYLASPAGAVTERKKPDEPSMPKGRHLRIVDKPERTQTQIQIGRLGTHPHDPDHVALVVGNAVFGGAFTARLMRAVRSERGWSYGASSRLAIDRVREAWSMWTFPASTDAVPCIGLELELMQQWIEGGITEEELAFAKSYLVKSHAFAVDTADKRLEQAIEVWLYDLPADYFSGYTRRVSEVSREAVNEALARRLSAQDLVLAVVASESDIGAALKSIPGLTSSEVVAFDADAG
jgi:zinc protease